MAIFIAMFYGVVALAVFVDAFGDPRDWRGWEPIAYLFASLLWFPVGVLALVLLAFDAVRALRR